MASGEQENDFGWTQLLSHQTPAIQPNILRINESLWYSTSYEHGEKGMVQYDYKTNKILNIVKYPQNITPRAHSCCLHQNKIYIIDSCMTQSIILFNPSDHSFMKKIKIPNLGAAPSSVVANDEIHIIGGNKSGPTYIVYSIKDNTIKQLKDQTVNKVGAIISLKYQDKIIKFGGIDCNQPILEYLGTFHTTSDKQENDSVKWTLQEQYKFKRGIAGCGCIFYDNHIVIFGGNEGDSEYFDSIHALDLKSDAGWIELQHMKCPLASSYRAVLDGDDNVHLFTQINQWPNWEVSQIRHFSIGIRDILPDIGILVNGYMRIYIFNENIINEDQYDILVNVIIIDYIGYVYDRDD